MDKIKNDLLIAQKNFDKVNAIYWDAHDPRYEIMNSNPKYNCVAEKEVWDLAKQVLDEEKINFRDAQIVFEQVLRANPAAQTAVLSYTKEYIISYGMSPYGKYYTKYLEDDVNFYNIHFQAAKATFKDFLTANPIFNYEVDIYNSALHSLSLASYNVLITENYYINQYILMEDRVMNDPACINYKLIDRQHIDAFNQLEQSRRTYNDFIHGYVPRMRSWSI